MGSKGHSFVTKNFNAPKVVEEFVEPRPSVESRKLIHEKTLLERDMDQINNAKVVLEKQLADATREHTDMLAALQKEQAAREDAEREHARLKEREAKQIKELDELRRKNEALSSDVRLR